MKIINEIPPRHTRHLKHTFIQGRDGNYYKVLAFQLYDTTPLAEFANFEVNVQKVNSDGKFKELIVPYLKRFKKKDEALKHYEELINDFDSFLKLPEVANEKHEEKEASGH